VYVTSPRKQRQWRPAIGDITSPLIGGFPASVERWRSLVTKYGAGIPINFLLAWIEKESGGNPCSWTTLRESGLFQLMFGDNLRDGGVTEEQLRAACVPNTQQKSRPLTAAEAEIQVSSGIRYVRAMMAAADRKLAATGVSWSRSSPSYWAFTKLQHGYPSPSQGWLTAATTKLGHPPRDWNEFLSTMTGYQSVLANATWVGIRSGVGGGGSVLPMVLLGSGVAFLWYLATRR
jgi:hypothetical protein